MLDQMKETKIKGKGRRVRRKERGQVQGTQVSDCTADNVNETHGHGEQTKEWEKKWKQRRNEHSAQRIRKAK